MHSLAICFVVQGRKRFVVGGREHLVAGSDFLLFTRGMRFQAEVLEAEPDRPYLSLVLHLDPDVIKSIIAELAPPVPCPPAGPVTDLPAAQVSPAGAELRAVLLRLLRSLPADADRRILAPMYLRELAYRLIHTDSVGELMRAAASERVGDPVSRAITYMRENLAEPLTVADLARVVMMSPSALTNAFVGATGAGPYRYMKRMRLDRAANLLIGQGRNVSEAARLIGYTSVSHFINDFKRHFGTTPRTYANAHRDAVVMFVDDGVARPDTGGRPSVGQP